MQVKGFRLELFPSMEEDQDENTYENLKQHFKDTYGALDEQIHTSCPTHVGNGYICNTIEIRIFLNPETGKPEFLNP